MATMTLKLNNRWDLQRKKTPEVTLNVKASEVVAAGTGANSAGVTTGGVAAKVLELVDDGGTTYYLPLFSSNA